MAGYRIAQLAERSGFTASTLRYYEQVGVLDRPVRTAAGYRVYDDDALDRLAFVDRAKRMGFALQEIAELVRLWADGDCSPVQHRMLALLDSRRGQVRGQVQELSAFAAQLDDVAARLHADRAPQRCGPGCGCEVTLSAPTARRRPLPTPVGRRQPVAIGCSLDATAMSDRLVEWHAMTNKSLAVTATAGGVRVRLPMDADLAAAVARLAATEVSCCPFFSITLAVTDGELELRIDAPSGAEELARHLVGPVTP